MAKGDIKQYYNDNKNDIIQKRLSGMQVKDIAKEYGIQEGTLSAYLLKDGIKWRTFNISMIPDIVNKYVNGASSKQLAKEYHIDPNHVLSILKNNNISIRDNSEAHQRYEINQEYFSNIDTPNKAYILGFLYADGCNHNKNGKYTISISLQENDKHILEDIKKELGYSGELRYIDQEKNRRKYKINRQNQWNLTINNKKLSNDLLTYGVLPDKSYSATFPKFLSDDLYPHFLRGLSDGDGCIIKNEDRWSYVGTYELLLGMKTYYEKVLNVHFSLLQDKRKRSLWELRIAGKKQVKKFLDYMYKDVDLKLNRKYELYLKKYC